jgi:hypothetical protein
MKNDSMLLFLSGLVVWLTVHSHATCQQKIAFIVPFVERDIDELSRNINTEWNEFPPFAVESRFSHLCVELLFYFSLTEDKLNKTRLSALFGNTRHRKSDFSSASFIFANLSKIDDKERVRGANAMFSNIFCNPEVFASLSSRFSHFFLMERDVHPIRQGWATNALRQSMTIKDFWIRGSAYYGSDPFYGTWQLFHLNGNALYALDATFRDQCVCRRPFEIAYDVQLFSMCYDFSKNRSLVQPFIHRFQYTSFIVNTYTDRTNYTSTRAKFPGAFLVHNKNFVYQ